MKNNNIFKIFFLVLSYISCSNLANTQDPLKINPKTKAVSISKIKLYTFGFGFEREQAITNLKTIYFGLSIESVIPFCPKQPYNYSDVLSIEQAVNFAPVLNLGIRKYNNFNEREKAEKTTLNNSGAFIGLEFSLIAPILINKRFTTRYTASLSPIWGFQKSLSKNSNLELSAGPSFQSDFDDYRVSGFVKFGINFLL